MRRVLDHDNVIKLLDVQEDPEYYYMILEYAANGEFFDYIGSGLREDMAQFYFRQLVLALEYMHSNNVCHRDLKLENILLDADYNLKVCDLGFSRLLSTTEGPAVMYTMCGSPAYVAPEVLLGQGYDGSAADIWSCGVILVAMLSACLPVEDRAWDGDPFYDRLKKHQYDYEPWGQQLHGAAEDLCKHMLEVDPQLRWKWPQIKSHPFYTGAQTSLAAALPALMQAQRLGQVPEPITAPMSVVYRSVPGGADLGAGQQGELATAERDGLDMAEIIKRQEIEASINSLVFFEGERTATSFVVRPGKVISEFVNSLAERLTAVGWAVRAEEGPEGPALCAKQATPRGKLAMRLTLARDEHGCVVGSCEHLQGDRLLFGRLFTRFARSLAA
eukprot:GAFH01001145.1.p2 GENE.GAFH01001145.1~~GAFH01001145.1.p2  ORF type:complete len:455 (-),score=125.62 GAFH01001145.1:539-1702(-)